MRHAKPNSHELAPENLFGMSLGDLMAGLLLIFILLLSFVMLRLEGLIAENRNQLEMMDEREQIKKILITRLLEELDKYEVEIDPQTGVIRIKEGVLFDFNRYDLKPQGKEFLRRFIPKYAEILLSDKAVYSQIAQIIIEGHTDNVGDYEYNLNLSLQRAQSVAAYLFAKDFGSFPFYQELRKLLSVNGRSFVEPRAENDTQEGRALNRRVEFKFRLKDWDMMVPLKRNLGEDIQQ